jgi:hypothetical protein
MTKGYARVKLGDMALESRAIRAAALGPGMGVCRKGFLRPVITPVKIQGWFG